MSSWRQKLSSVFYIYNKICVKPTTMCRVVRRTARHVQPRPHLLLQLAVNPNFSFTEAHQEARVRVTGDE